MTKFLTATVLTFSLTLATTFPASADEYNVAHNKPTRSNLSKILAQNVTDGDLSTAWSGVFFPAYVDVDLMEQYDIEKIVLHFPEGKSSYYTLYGSNDGKNYDRIYRTREALKPTDAGEQITFDTPQSYRIVRVQVEYTEADNKAYLSEIKVYGKKTSTGTGKLRQGSLDEILGVKHFDQTEYSRPITDEETIENVFGIIDRTVGAEYRGWFSFELVDKRSTNDWFELGDYAGKVQIKGNNGLSLATGLNYYFKNYANVHISEQTKQVNMPERIIPIGGTVRKETPYKVRYAFNYCTLNYTFSFFGEEGWQRENDWLALNGVNVVLDLAGQEATWIKFLMNFGYSFDDAKDWLTGPAYYAWQFMDNMESFGGPVPDGYVKDRLELARSTQRWKRSLGMQTVLQGYAGMVPTNFPEFQPDAKVIKQGNWNGFARPWMIATDSPQYDDYAREFYEAQEFVYGKTSDYYAVDPFHEGGIRSEGLTDDIISHEVLESLLEYDKDAVWIVQGWQSNPTNSLLRGMGEHRNKHVLIVDLIKYPLKSWTKYNKLKYDNTTLDSLEFNGTDWAWCLLANFGGNPSMHGQMDVMVNDIMEARQNSKHMQGIGIISEATYDNPIVYDLIFDLVWAGQDFDLGRWIDKYIERRYGKMTDNARKAWEIMRETNYDYGVRYTNELFGMKSKGPQDYRAQEIPYGAHNLEKAFRLLAADLERFKDNECYRYDMTEIMRQLVSNYAVMTYNNVLKARDDKSLVDFTAAKEKFLLAFDILNEVQATQREQLGGEWIGKATDRADGYDDFARDAFAMNAKTLITTWGSRGGSSLKDYGWRNYEGVFIDIYKRIWSEYLNKVERNLRDGTPVEAIRARDYFDFYWNWIMGEQNYTRAPKDSPQDISRVIGLVKEHCSLGGDSDPNAGNLALGRNVIVNAGKSIGKPSWTTDGSTDTHFRVLPFKKGRRSIQPEITVDMLAEFQISKVDLKLESSQDVHIHLSPDNVKWEKIDRLTADGTIESGDFVARFVKVTTPNSSDGLSVKELRVYGERILPTQEQLRRLVGASKALDLTADSDDQTLRAKELLETAERALANAAPPDEVNTAYWNLYDHLVSMEQSGRINIAKGRSVTAHNDPAGKSGNINDGDNSTYWDSGRLSATGKPYEDKITPGWVVIDLESIHVLDEIRLTFPKKNVWHKYEIYLSDNNKKWRSVGVKTTETTPNEMQDTYVIKGMKARYIKIQTTDIQTDNDGKRTSYSIGELEVYGRPMQ